MENVSAWTITLVGIITVFSVFVILFMIFKLMEIAGISRNRKVKIPESKTQNLESISDSQTQAQYKFQSIQNTQKITFSMADNMTESEEIAAVFGAIYSIMDENAIVKSITPLNQMDINKNKKSEYRKGTREWYEWRTYGWRGGNKW
ncbi:MAG: OadG family protein [Fervidobacterium pennivorans]